MSRQSSQTVKYADLLELSQLVVSERIARLSGARARGTGNLEPLAHQVEVAKTLERMVKKGLPGRQTDFAELFEQVKK